MMETRHRYGTAYGSGPATVPGRAAWLRMVFLALFFASAATVPAEKRGRDCERTMTKDAEGRDVPREEPEDLQPVEELSAVLSDDQTALDTPEFNAW